MTTLNLQESKNNCEQTTHKIKTFGVGLFVFFVLFSASTVSAQQDFNKFLARFRNAIIRNDKKTVVALTNFPLPYVTESSAESGQNLSYSKGDFMSGYTSIFDKTRRQCFKNSSYTNNEPASKNDKSIECGGRENYNGEVFYFSRTKSGWKLTQIAYSTTK